MIFGFNTDIKNGNTVYHVQSEARQNERLLQTQIFVRGQCIGKKAVSYAELVSHPEFSEARMHEMLKSQHRNTVESVRGGNIEEALTQVRPLHEVLGEISGVPIAQVGTGSTPAATLSLEFLESTPVLTGETIHLRFRVLDGNAPVHGARLISKVTSSSEGPEQQPIFAETQTESDGCCQMEVRLQMTAATVLVQASYAGRSATKKFRVTK